MKLLLVDDEIFAIQGIINGVNWEVLEYDEVLQANSYAQAVELLNEKRIDIAVCDIEMPDESGLELVGWIHEHSPHTECIIFSCHDEFDFARQALQLSCLDYILKPVRYDFLTDVLRKAAETIKQKKHHNTLKDYGQIYIDTIRRGSGAENNEDIVDKIVNYIDQHLQDDLSVRILANAAYVSPDHLTRLFKKRFGQTVTDYIFRQRMTLAGELLKDSKLTVTMVSDCVGYGNYSYFTEQFKKFYGMTPREYQNIQRKR